MTDRAELISKLSIVIPAYNEEAGIALTLKSLTKLFPGAEIILVDDGSTDGTAEIAGRYAGVNIHRQHFNRGYGAALKAGMALSSRQYVAWFDADNEHRAEDLMAMLETIDRENVVAVIGQRLNFNNSGLRYVGKFFIQLIARTMGVRIGPDINCGLRVFQRTAIMSYCHVLPDGFSASLTSLMLLIERGYSISFQQVSLNRREGTSKVVVLDGFKTAILVLRMVMLVAPLRIFLGLGLIFIVLGIFYGAGMAAATGRGVPAAAVISITAGLLFGFQGLIADQISQIRLSQLDKNLDESKSIKRPESETYTKLHK